MTMRGLLQKAKLRVKRGAGWVWERRLRVAALILVLALVVPRPVKSQFLDPCCAILASGLATISSTLSSAIGGGRNSLLSVNQNIQGAAPGSAPILEAQADAWLVRANAYTQAATADLMRVRAAALADASADLKLGATNTAGFQQKVQNMLQPKQ